MTHHQHTWDLWNIHYIRGHDGRIHIKQATHLSGDGRRFTEEDEEECTEDLEAFWKDIA